MVERHRTRKKKPIPGLIFKCRNCGKIARHRTYTKPKKCKKCGHLSFQQG